MKWPEWSLVQYRVDDSEKLAVGVSVDGTVVQGPPGTEGLTLMEVLGRWDSLAPLLRDWNPAASDVVAGARLAPPLTYPGQGALRGRQLLGPHRRDGLQAPRRAGRPVLLPQAADDDRDGTGRPGAAARLRRRPRRLGGRTRRRHRPCRPQPRTRAGHSTTWPATWRRTTSRPGTGSPRRCRSAEPFTYDWVGHKGQDGFCPLGPGLVPAWQIPDPQNLRIRLSVNGVVKQDSSTAQMMVPIPEVIAAASRITRLEPGDVILTGTPAGCGVPRGEFLAAGDEIVVEIERIGRMENKVVAS